MLTCCILAILLTSLSIAQPFPTDLSYIETYPDGNWVGHSQRGFIENAKLSSTKNDFSVQLVTWLGVTSASWKVYIDSGSTSTEVYSRIDEPLQFQFVYLPYIPTPWYVFMKSDTESFRFATTQFADGSAIKIRVVADVRFELPSPPNQPPVVIYKHYDHEFQFQAYNKLQLLATTVGPAGEPDTFLQSKSSDLATMAADIFGTSHTPNPPSVAAHLESKSQIVSKVLESTALVFGTHGHPLLLLPSTWSASTVTADAMWFAQDIQPQVAQKMAAQIPPYNFLFFYCCNVLSNPSYMQAAYGIPTILNGAVNKIACGFAMAVVPVAFTTKEWAGELDDKGLPINADGNTPPGVGIDTHLQILLDVAENGYFLASLYFYGTVGNGILFVNYLYQLPGKDPNTDVEYYLPTTMSSVGDPHTRIWNVHLGNYTAGQLNLPNTREGLNRWYLHLSP